MSVRVRMPDLEHWKEQVKCQVGCPVRTDAGRYVQLIAEGREEEAFLVARAPNPFASVCGRVCAAPCEDACRRGNIDAPISIRALKRYVTERFGVESVRPDTQDRLFESLVSEGNRFSGHLPVHPRPRRGDGRPRVAVVGAGPAGLAAVFLAVGVSKGRDLQLAGVELDGVVKAVDYLLNVNRGYRMNLGRRVVVIGGGFVAFDAA